MADTGILIVSHSKNLAQGLFDLISQVAADVAISYVGGLDDGSIGTSFEGIQAALDANDKDTILAFFDLGSARMNLEMVADFSDKEIIINNVPLVEGAYTAAALLQAGADLPNVLLQVREQSKDHTSNPFLRKQCSQLAEASVFRTVQQIPGVGKTKALLLLQQFGSIHQICTASVKELELVVGQTVAQQIHTFLGS